eukprot:CAMPEP_0204109798 /NCGR_PEP_ID=MMETSP0361-20130328/1505_1 /ASSEMBLY_ACC=CAM_ASM_000343 /TAXON_ID=268821 /ORGANISM="Scrippsiella Hangoei, Strain SHTV-5" /LENGTH=114 /DNA_ID=CAMNT_0051059609 /DNA_START=55 /DNA_END=396 /DNA_ORIENTATION=-
MPPPLEESEAPLLAPNGTKPLIGEPLEESEAHWCSSDGTNSLMRCPCLPLMARIISFAKFYVRSCIADTSNASSRSMCNRFLVSFSSSSLQPPSVSGSGGDRQYERGHRVSSRK